MFAIGETGQNFCIAVRDWKLVLRRSASSLRFSAALGIARTSSALRSLARKFQALSINLTNTPF